jgi:hypothetical protein
VTPIEPTETADAEVPADLDAAPDADPPDAGETP